MTVANTDGTQVKSTVIPDAGIREVQVDVTARPVGSDSSFTPVAGQDVTVALTNSRAGEIDGGSPTTVRTNETGIATTEFSSATDIARREHERDCKHNECGWHSLRD